MSVPSVGIEEPNFTCLIVLCFVMFGSSLHTEGMLMSYCTVFCEVRSSLPTEGTLMSYCIPSVGKEEPNFTKHSTIRHERSFCG
jgi:hypothetical protein